MHLTSLQNPKIKAIKRLEKSSERRAQHALLLEGLRELCLASRAGHKVLEVYICEELIVESAQYNLADCDLTEAARYTVTREVYQSIANRDTT
jgi:hypothetical protein